MKQGPSDEKKKKISVRILFWNIMGRMNFIKTEYPLQWLKNNFDVLFISETHLTKGQQFHLDGFKDYHNSYSEYDAKKPRGGISCFIKHEFVHRVNEVQRDSEDNVTIIWKGGNKTFGSYIPPDNSPYFDPVMFCHLANNFTPIDNEHIVIGGGDINSRIGNKHLHIPFSGSYYNHNVDEVVNSHGREIRKLCRSYNSYVVNNLVIGDRQFQSNFTFHRGDSKSQNDIILANKSGLESLNSFSLHEIGWNPSDHIPISLKCDLCIETISVGKLASIDILSDNSAKKFLKPKKIDPNKVNWNMYKEVVNNDFKFYQQKIDNLSENSSLHNLNNAVESLSKPLYIAASTSTQHVNKNKEEIFQKHEVLKIADQAWKFYKDGGNEPEAWNKARNDAIEYLKNVASAKEHDQWNKVLSSKDSKQMWNKINWKGSLNNETFDGPELKDLCDHFKAKSQTTDNSSLLCEVTGSNYVEILDKPIELDEIKKAMEKLKEDKVSGDGWAKGMLVNAPVAILYAIQIIFNVILGTHFFPTKWRTTIVSELFKNKGSPTDATKYRPITLVQLLAKLFDLSLFERFRKWFTPSDQQTAYQSKRSGADHVFLIRCLIQRAKLYKEKLFIIAIDFDGAFDRISRSILIRKLVLFGAGTLFVTCLASIYMHTDNIIFRHKDYMVYTLSAGIKQGLPLSPYIFLFYVDDLFDFFDSIYGISTDIIYEMIHILLHADDATLLAYTRNLAISKLRSLSQYCSLNCIIPQYAKCEFIVINGNKEDKKPMEFGDRFIKNSEFIKLLGSHLSQKGNILDDLNFDFNSRFRSCIKYYNFLRSNRRAPLYVKFKVLKACVISSLLHNCESFGNKVPKDLENQYFKLIKSTLGVRQSTPNLILLIESGLLPLHAIITSRQLKFFKRFGESIHPGSSRSHVFQMLKADENEPYIQHYVDISQKYSSQEDIYKEYLTDIKQQVNTLADQGNYKYQIYRQFNPTLEPSPFLNLAHPHSDTAIKFRLGSHKLPIETGRWMGLERKDRLCTECNILGDESHYLFYCSRIKRDDFMFSGRFDDLWKDPNVFQLFSRLKDIDVL